MSLCGTRSNAISRSSNVLKSDPFHEIPPLVLCVAPAVSLFLTNSLWYTTDPKGSVFHFVDRILSLIPQMFAFIESCVNWIRYPKSKYPVPDVRRFHIPNSCLAFWSKPHLHLREGKGGFYSRPASCSIAYEFPSSCWGTRILWVIFLY